MTIRSRFDDKIIGTVTANHSMTLDEAMSLIGHPWVVDDDTNDAGYLVNGIYYGPDDLMMEYDS